MPMAGAQDGLRTILIAPEPMLKKMLAAKNVNSPLITRADALKSNLSYALP